VPGGPLKRARSFMRRNLSPEQEQEKPAVVGDSFPPAEWETAYDLRVWPDFPDRPSRNT
jgi:hypothetical protein